MTTTNNPEQIESFKQWIRDVEAETLIMVADVQAQPDNQDMSDPLTRPELDAKLATVEARMDGRLARIDDKLAGIEKQIDGQKNAIWYATSVIIATFVAVFAVFVASFDSGRDTAKMAADAQAQTNAALAEIRQLVSEIKAQPAPPSP